MATRSAPQIIEVRAFKYPRRPTSVAHATLLGEDKLGRWLGIAKGSGWHSADHENSGLFVESFVKFVPHCDFWSACFHPVDPQIDVDIILPVCWQDATLEEVDLEIDILRNADGKVWVRDQDKFEHMRNEWNLPDTIAKQAMATCEEVRLLVEQAVEPFGKVGLSWLRSFMAEQGKS